MKRHGKNDLIQMQSLPLKAKIIMSCQRIQQWYNAWDGGVYVSFSGGKDSTVLLDIVRSLFPDVLAVFSDTGLEYPEIRQFVKSTPNVEIIRPEMNFRQVIIEKGYPVVSKEVARAVKYARKTGTRSGDYYMLRFNNELMYDGKPSRYNMPNWKFLLDAPFKVSPECCEIMKKKPFHNFERERERELKPFLGTMAAESRVRYQAWIRTGCNAFEGKKPHSAPLSFWTEQDVLEYIKVKNLPYCREVYGDIVETGKEYLFMGTPTGRKELKTTRADRTGCMFCMFGCHLEKEPNRFQRMKEDYPKQYDFCMRPISEGGLGEAEVLDYIKCPH